jgi:high-affinity Fe2+/Pb2+ permease
MSRVGMVIGLVIAFIGWILYRLLIKKDLKKNLNNVYLGLFFIGVWVLFYFFIVHIF